LKPSRSDNHWLDCLVGCAVAASICGVSCPATRAVRAVNANATHRRVLGGEPDANPYNHPHAAGHPARRPARPRLPLLRLQALPRHLYPTGLGRPDCASPGVPPLWRTDDDLGECEHSFGVRLKDRRFLAHGLHIGHRDGVNLSCTRGSLARSGFSHVTLVIHVGRL
jgi:hypothetical protein